MQPAIESRTVTARGVASAASFGMRSENSAHIFNILRSTLYSNKVLAVLREYAANAWDEHRAAGCPDRPIRVVIPAALEPTLRIRDYGRGLSEQQVFEVYTQYGSSTKRDSDDVVGCLGIGSKSAFAYADAFTVTSWHGGTKSIYVALLDETNVGTMSLMHREPCEPCETGVEISLAVSVADCDQFRREAEDLFPHFIPRPDISITLDKPRTTERSAHGGVGGDRWVAVMGCIPYALDLSAVRDFLNTKGWGALANYGGILRFEIGEVSISASRESLEYTNRTKEAICRKVEALVADLQSQLDWIAIDPSLTDWERRLASCKVVNSGAVYSTSRWTYTEVSLIKEGAGNDPRTFMMRRLARFSTKLPEACGFIWVSEGTRIIVRDVNRSHRGYDIAREDRIVYPASGMPIDAVLAELECRLRGAGLEGIPVVRMSDMPYTSQSRGRTASPTTPAKTERVFVMKTSARYDHNSPSSNWEAIDHTPTEDDVFVILDGFRPQNERSFYDQVRDDRNLLQWLDRSMPRIIGHRKSLKNPLVDVPGTPYHTWRIDAPRRAIEANPEKLEAFRAFHWRQYLAGILGWRTNSTYARLVAETVSALTPGGVMHEFWSAFPDMPDMPKPEPDSYMMRSLSEVLPDEVQNRVWEVYARYPILDTRNRGPGMGVFLVEGLRPHWIAYVNLIDRTDLI
jgi:hypothetical protein